MATKGRERFFFVDVLIQARPVRSERRKKKRCAQEKKTHTHTITAYEPIDCKLGERNEECAEAMHDFMR